MLGRLGDGVVPDGTVSLIPYICGFRLVDEKPASFLHHDDDDDEDDGGTDAEYAGHCGYVACFELLSGIAAAGFPPFWDFGRADNVRHRITLTL